MAATSKAQLKSANLDPIDGGSLIYHVTNLSGTDPATVMSQACSAAGIPQRNDPFAPGLIVTGGPKVIEMLGNFDALVEVVVGKNEIADPGGGFVGTFEMSTRVVDESTCYDAGGLIIKLRLDPGQSGLGVSRSLTEEVEQTGEVTRRMPVTVIRVTAKENTLPIYASYRHVGTTNAGIFCGFPPEYWLCAEVSATSNDGNRTFQTAKEFWGNQYGWLQYSAFKQETGLLFGVTPDVTLADNPPRLRYADNAAIAFVRPRGAHQIQFNGMTLVRVQATSDFDRFGITLPSNLDAP